MAKEERISDSSGSSSNKYQVFLSFRGPDTRQGFTDTLFEYLRDAGIRVFRDNNELRPGREIGAGLMQAIEDSQIYIPIFSKTYAESKWCLRELAKMVEMTRKSKEVKEIIPIFCGVTVDDVKRKDGLYDVAVNALGHGEDSETVVQWKEALKEVCKIKGWELKDEGHAKFCKPVVRKISVKLGVDDQVKVRNRVKKRAYLAKLLWIMAVSISGAVVSGYVNQVYRGKQADEVGRWCDLRAKVLQDRFIFHRNQMQVIGNLVTRFYYSRNPLDGKKMQELFANINSTGHLNPFFNEIVYTANVVKEERERLNFERRHGREIKEFDDNKDYYPRTSPVRDAVIFYAAPDNCTCDDRQFVSLDHMTSEEEKHLKARQTGSFGLSNPIKLISNNDRDISIGFLLTYPVYRADLDLPYNTASEDRINVILGYTRVLFNFTAFAKTVFLELNDTNTERIRMSIYDITDSSHSKPLIIYGDYYYDEHGSSKHVSPLELGDFARKYTLICSLVEEELDYSWVAGLQPFLYCFSSCLLCSTVIYFAKKSEELVFKLAYLEARLDQLIFGYDLFGS